MERDMKYFMQDRNKEDEIVEVPGIERYKDKDGKVIPLQIRVMNQREIQEIYKKYQTKKPILDKKGVPYVRNGSVIMDVETDGSKALRRIMVEALVYPNLKDKALMDFYNCPGYDDMPFMLFPDPKEYNYVQDQVLKVLGINPDDDEENSDKEAAKN